MYWVIVHPFDGEAWKHFNSVHPQFLPETRNMHLGLCTNKFNLFRSFAAQYSYWSMIFIAYNLPLRMCMRLKFMFLSTVIHNPNSLDRNIDVFLQLLIDELKQLWSSGTLDYNVFRKQNFLIKETLMQTINDFLAYKMVSSWRIHGKLACPYCMKNNKAFTPTNNGKTSFFFTATNDSCQLIIGSKRIEMTFLLAGLKGMLHRYLFQVRNYIMWCQSMMALCLVFNLVSRSFLVLVGSIIR